MIQQMLTATAQGIRQSVNYWAILTPVIVSFLTAATAVIHSLNTRRQVKQRLTAWGISPPAKKNRPPLQRDRSL